MRLLNLLKEKRAASAAENFAAYRALLLRGDAPKKGDAERLAELMSALQLDEAAVAEHVRALEVAATAQAGIDQRADLSSRKQAVETEISAQRAELARVADPLREKLAGMVSELKALDSELIQHSGADTSLRQIHRKYPDLFGLRGTDD